jgi:hypothetical protein
MSHPTLPAELQTAIVECRKNYWITASLIDCVQSYNNPAFATVRQLAIKQAIQQHGFFIGDRKSLIDLSSIYTTEIQDAVLDAFEQLPKLPSPQKLLIDLKLGGAS